MSSAAPPQVRSSRDSAIDRTLLARELARHGRATRSALAVMSAAQILLDNPARPLEEGGALVAPADSADAYATGPGRDLDPRSLLAEARLMAVGNGPLVAVVSQLEQRAESQARGHIRGVVAGPRQRYGRLSPGARHAYGIRFSAGQSAVVYVGGDADVPLELRVFDRGTQVAFDRGSRDKSVVEWRPARTSQFTVQIRNPGVASTWYILLTN